MKLYSEHNTSELFEFRTPTIIAAFTENSIMKTTPLRKIIEENMGDRPFKRKLSIASSDLNKGQVIYFDETMANDERVDAILSSAAISFAFPPVNMRDMTLVDGSLFSTVSVGDPIERCREEVTRDEDIIIDVILCYEDTYEIEDWSLPETRWRTALDFYRRRKEINKYYYYEEDIMRITRGYHNINFRLLIKPGIPLTSNGFLPINATHEEIMNEIGQGYLDGLNATD